MPLSFRKYLLCSIADLNRLSEHPSFDLQQADEVREIVRETGRRAVAAGIPAAVKLCDVRNGGLAAVVGREILAACLGALSAESIQSNDVVSIDEAARVLGYSASGVRKLVRRRAIQFSQSRPHAPIKFRREWLEAFQTGNGPQATTKPTRRMKVKQYTGSKFVDVSLFDV